MTRPAGESRTHSRDASVSQSELRSDDDGAQSTLETNRPKLCVLFMQSQSYFGSDSMIHSLLMQEYDRGQVEVHVACHRGTSTARSASLEALMRVPDLRIRATNFGPTLYTRSGWAILGSLPSTIPMLADLAALVRYVRRHRIDIIHCTEKPRDAFYGVLLAKLTGAKSVVHLHVKCEDWMSPLVRWAMWHADAIVGVSRFVAESAVHMGYPEAKVRWILNGIDASRWDPTLDGSAVRSEFGIGTDEIVLTIASRMFHWKGHLELVRALARVGCETTRFRLLIVGADDLRGAPGRGSLTAELKTLVADLGMEQQVVFAGFRSDIASVLAASDIYAMPTFEEPCAVAFLEAMAMARPIVALRSGGTPEIVTDGICGLLSEPADIEGLATNLAWLMKEPGTRRRMGASGRHRVESFLTPSRMANDGVSIYRELISRSPGTRAGGGR